MRRYALAGDPKVRWMARQHWRMGAVEMWRSVSKAAFVRSVARLVPAVTAADLTQAGASIRAQAVLPDGTLVNDFLIEEGERSVHVLNASSPAQLLHSPSARRASCGLATVGAGR